MLPPGLANHGNTCFMNSVLQGLIAARLFRSAQLWDSLDLPIAHSLFLLLREAHIVQRNRTRENLSPRDLLAALGSKYDQYLDFRQQDAHEFFCQLLDAVRTEESDLIKQRPDDPLRSVVDALFGGQLASILVCQTCKHVSHTCEDFTDLSLSIKPEDYVRERKRDRLKQFAKRIGTALYVAAPQQRSSSVPATPVHGSDMDSAGHRRRSIDLADVDVDVVPVPPSPVPDSPSVPPTPTDTPSVAVSIVVPVKANGKERKEKDKDESWAKLSRRISVSVGLTKRPKQKKTDDPEPPLPERASTSLKQPQPSPSHPSTPRFPLISRPSSPRVPKAPKAPRTPKLGVEEAAYLRDILADINPPNVPKPFSIFKQSTSASSQSIFLKVNQINRIEECLRLFTSVEILDGDNTVRCRRCWKIANGFYKPRAAQEPDTDSEDDDDDDGQKKRPAKLAIPLTSSSAPASPSRSTMSLNYTRISSDTQPYSPTAHVPPALQLNDMYPIELVSPVGTRPPNTLSVPSISTTAPETPMTAKPALARSMTQPSVATEFVSRTSLSAPPDQHRQHAFRSGDSNTESEISEAESETLLSVYSSVSSVASSNNPSSSASQDQLQPPSLSASTKKKRHHPSGVPHNRQFLLRPAYKRYLIATPPPILVVHLKRFQQLSKAPVVSFSTGFKKLDDYIAFPERLDLAPYLAPRREDYFDSKVAVTRGRARRSAPCMYRLCAVVVHIGNMLGGHYVAYTALPPPPSDADATQPERQRDWAFVSDTAVRLSSLEEVLKSKAYMCMYERI